MRRLLLKVLVIAVFLNTVVGLPLHAALHLAAGGAAEGSAGGSACCPSESGTFDSGTSESSTADPGAPDSGTAEFGADDEHDERAADASCAWCLAQAEATGAPPALPGPGQHGDWREPCAAAQTAVPAVFSAGLWSSAPRGPPSA
jgi:hypothetical protein